MAYTGEACSHVSQSGISFHFPASESKCRVELRYKVVNDDYVLASFPGSPSPRTNYTRVTFDLAERLRESLVHFGT